ncbi:MAG: hypothetical protein NWF05_05375 [Candidatus Bathyarchaeota archaeon]|nr:hypothetical protein [Candidatus Bathyarchaeota archaeon]
MVSKGKVLLGGILLAVIGLSVVFGAYSLLHSDDHSSNSVDKYTDGFPDDIKDMLKPMGNDGIIDANEMSVLNELKLLKDHGYIDSPVVKDVVRSIMSDGNVSGAEALWKITDIDQDGIINSLEINTHHTDPTNIYTSGKNLDDFNAIYTYGIDPNNGTAVDEFLAKIPNVVARQWEPTDGGQYRTKEQHIELSKRDPLLEYYAKKSEIKMFNSTDGFLLVDGTPIHGRYDENYQDIYNSSLTIPPGQPSFFFTHGRTTTCAPTSHATITILQIMGYKCREVVGENSVSQHSWPEVLINERVFVVDYGRIYPIEEFQEKYGYVPFERYDPNWYLK